MITTLITQTLQEIAKSKKKEKAMIDIFHENINPLKELVNVPVKSFRLGNINRQLLDLIT